ncbi:DEAD/DEAH box helicase [Heyndrickxia sporothermodurans]|uniref:Helicase ATP-binding domain-containing protein n=1 Tax=Heyndrickxia sporothermodurans TaxID=46224 RepID=A0A150LG87_9BACI|nr:DEAD/DEAH box helicase [Heyndrickxia sporothermodurans]KYD11049.1 hypothetical protein B4102_0109 [Heyndrickxia sporothermodurans]MED3649608.1 DEAD/DEAH box helicase family protein [Heyndrickxia sporothermodurans]MED3699896.1 DEAD/DEAH box helicase family protein [Heyndrickxia sporothermodurans]
MKSLAKNGHKNSRVPDQENSDRLHNEHTVNLSHKRSGMQNFFSEKRLHNAPEQTHLVNFYNHRFMEQPKKNVMGTMYVHVKRQKSIYKRLDEILERFSQGYCGILAHVNYDIAFVSTDLFAIDVDDDHKKTTPHKVFEQTGACGLFYTFSHGLKGNRYRLLFKLDEPVTNKKEMREIIKLVADTLRAEGIPTDSITNVNTIIRGGKSGRYHIDEHKALSTANLRAEAIKRNEVRQKALYQEAENKDYRPLDFKELKELAEAIGHIPTHTGQREKWTDCVMAIKHQENLGLIEYEEGYELFDIISGGETREKEYKNWSTNGLVGVGTLIHYARENGYKGSVGKNYYPEHITTTKKLYDVKNIRVSRYIPTETMTDFLQGENRLLLDSPTGSGKTEATVKAFEMLSDQNPNHFYVFAVPTTTLTQQIALKYGIQGLFGTIDKLGKKIYYYAEKEAKKIFVCTYDKAPKLIEMLQRLKPWRYTLVVDEYHKIVTDLNYRYQAIKELYDITKGAKTFLALSGTTDDIDKNQFDEVIKIKNGHEAAPITDFVNYTYENKNDGLTELAVLLQERSKQTKVIVYIEAKEKIEILYHTLRKKGINVQKITSDIKKQRGYKEIVENEKIADDIQVILATSVIADGINILNTPRLEVIVVCNEFSNFFTPSIIKQISHRPRNHYDRFSIYMQEQKQEDTCKPYNIEKDYYWKTNNAKRLAEELNKDPYFDPLLFHRSIIENRYGLDIDKDTKEVIYDVMKLRTRSAIDQKNYYRGNRESFVKVVEKILRAKETRHLNISESIRNNTLGTDLVLEAERSIQDEFERLERKYPPIGKVFTTKAYEAFLNEDENELKQLEKRMEPRHYRHLRQTTKIASYETCKLLVKQVKRDADAHRYINDLQAMNDIIYLESVHRNTPTKKVLKAILNIPDWQDWQTTNEYKKSLEKLAKKVNLTKKDIKAVERMLQIENRRIGEKRTPVKRIVGTITIDLLAKRYGISPATIEQNLYVAASLNINSTFKKVVKTKLKRLQPIKQDTFF